MGTGEEGEACLDNLLFKRLEHLFKNAPKSRSIETWAGVAVGSLGGARAENQDRAAVAHIHWGESAQSLLVAVVCDGMGGMQEGGYAAATAISAFIARIALRGEPLSTLLRHAIEHANLIVNERLRGAGGTTLTAVVVLPSGSAWAVHAGDSRLYKFLPSEDPELVTQDDTVESVVRGNIANWDEDDLDSRLLQFVGLGSGFVPHVFPLGNGRSRCWFVTSDGAHAVGRKVLHGLTENAISVSDLVRKLVFVVDAVPTGDNASVAAISGAEFDVAATFSEGLSLTVWTPTDRLDLWMPVLSAQEQKRKMETAEARSQVRTSPRSVGKKRKSKTESRSHVLGEAKRNKSQAPQLKISFSDDEESV